MKEKSTAAAWIRSTTSPQPCEASVSLAENSIVAGAERRKNRAGGPDDCASPSHGYARPGGGRSHRLDRTTAFSGSADAIPRGASRCAATARAVRARTTVSTNYSETAARGRRRSLPQASRGEDPAAVLRRRLIEAARNNDGSTRHRRQRSHAAGERSSDRWRDGRAAVACTRSHVTGLFSGCRRDELGSRKLSWAGGA